MFILFCVYALSVIILTIHCVLSFMPIVTRQHFKVAVGPVVMELMILQKWLRPILSAWKLTAALTMVKEVT